MKRKEMLERVKERFPSSDSRFNFYFSLVFFLQNLMKSLGDEKLLKKYYYHHY